MTPGQATRKVALYARVSTVEEDRLGQIRDFRQEAARRGWKVVGVYSEKVSACRRSERHTYGRLLRDTRGPSRDWGVLTVWSIDLFSRGEPFTKAVEATWVLEKLGISFISGREPYPDTPPEGE